MEVNKERRRMKAGGAGLYACRAVVVMLFVMLVFTMMPLIAPGTNDAYAAQRSKTSTPDDGIKYVKSLVGKGVDKDGAPSGIKDAKKGTYWTEAEKCQCVDLAQAYEMYFGDHHPRGNGVDYLTNKLPAGWVRVIGGTPQKGDILVYGASESNEYGHVAIYESEKVTYHQNYAGHHYVQKVTNVKYNGLTNPYKAYIRPNWKDVDNVPMGKVESCKPYEGKIYVKGWAYDPDRSGDAIEVHVWLDRTSKNPGTKIGVVKADKTRKDVNKTYKCGSKHGFEGYIDTSKYKAGKHTITFIARGINSSGKFNSKNKGLKNSPCERTLKPVKSYEVITEEASNVLNTSATISGNLDKPAKVKSWGFYLGTSESDMAQHKYQVGLSPIDSTNMKAQVEDYVKPELQPGTKYWYKVYANVTGKEQVSKTYRTFTTSSEKPDIPVLKVDPSSEEIGIGDVPAFKWTKAKYADYYKLYIYNEKGDEVSVIDNIQGELCSAEAMQEAGTYTARLESWNSVGTKGKSDEVSFTVYPNVKVKFYDKKDKFADTTDNPYEPAFLGEQEIPWGHDADFPAKPEHTGYTFTGWSDEAKNVKPEATGEATGEETGEETGEDTAVCVYATYDINTYTVKFVDSSTGSTLRTDTVEYYHKYELSDLPDYSVDSNHAKIGFNGWDKNYECITEDTTFYTCVGWYDENLPIHAEITNAVREYDAASSEDEGYTVTVDLQNWDQGTTKGRVVVALKTSEGKLLTSTESAAFNVKSNAKKEIEVFVPYTNAASTAEAYVIGQYKDAVPISESATFEIDQSSTMTNWSTEEPPAGAQNVEQRTEYRYQDKQTTTSYSTSLAGYTQDGGTWVKQSSGTIDYVTSFPSGYNKSSAYYTKYNGVKPKTASETATDKTTVSTSTVGYIYWHWCRGDTSGPGNRLVSDCKEGSYTHWHCFRVSSAVSFDSSAKAFYKKYPDICKDSYWWVTTYANKNAHLPVKRCTYNTYKKQFNYYKWTDWSNWSTTPVTASGNKKVETRTVYRYQVAGAMDEDTSGKLRTISGAVDSSFSGMEATLFVYKINEASDFTNEYVGQTKIGADGEYTFNFKLREEPSYLEEDYTGDLTVALGIEGTTTPIFLDPIEPDADKRVKHTVRYFDWDADPKKDEPLYSVEVEDHGNAPLPPSDIQPKERAGHTFTNWSNTNLNVTEDRDLIAEYKKNIYTVVFVNWEDRTVSMDKIEYGTPLVCPPLDEPPEGKTLEWDGVVNGQEVTSDMIITTKCQDKELSVTILDEKGNIDNVETVKYGMAVSLPDEESMESSNKEFIGWEDVSNGEPEGLENTVMTTNAILCPVYSFNETVANPTADLAQGEYDSAQTVKLSCDTPGADIYYTLDGSNPAGLNSTLYDGPIEIDGPVELKFYASKFEMNDSDVQTRLYSVNYDGATSKYMLEEDLPQDVADNPTEYHVQFRDGYRYKDTKSVTTLAEAAALEAGGWSTDPEAEPVYDEYTDWSDQMPSDAGDYINLDVDTKPVYTTADQFTYSHYVYEDGVTKYAPAEVDGFECTYEETDPFDEPLYYIGKDADGNRCYSYDGKIWYNQKQVSGEVQTGTKYRWRHQEVQYTKWSDWTITKPSSSEEREYESHEVVNYIRPNYHVVTVHYGEDTWAYLAEDGSLAEIEDPNAEDEGRASQAYNALGVYTDKDYTHEWNLETDKIDSSIELFVKTEKKTFDVYFVDDASVDLGVEAIDQPVDSLEDHVIAKQTVTYGEAAEAPQAPAKEGYRFARWDSDAYTNVTEDLVIYANYVPEDEYATVTLDNESLTLYKGKSVELTAVISPLSKSDTQLTWTSSNEDVAVVTDEGEVTAVGKGTADITVMVNETRETATCTVTVNVDSSDSLVLIKNDKLSIDSQGFLRGAKGEIADVREGDTVADILEYFDNANLKCVNMAGEEVAPTDLFGTGYQVQLTAGEAVKDAIEAVVTGDFSGDGSINNKDVSLLLRHLMDKVDPTNAQVAAGDVNGSGRVDARDAVLTLRVIVGKDKL